MKRLRCGLLGAGMMGREHLKNLALMDDVSVVVVCDSNAEMLGKAHGLAPDAQFVSSVSALLAVGIDALIIATPNFMHASHLLDILAVQNLPVLIEKPLVTNLEDISRLRAAMRAREAFVWVGMEYRYMPALTAFSNQMGAVGAVKMLSIREHRYPFLQKVENWNRFNRYSGGTFVEKCCHFFDLMRLYLQADPIRVYASAAQDVNHLSERYNGEQPDIWDNGFVIVDFNNGTRGCLDLCMFAEGVKFEQEVSLVGDKARLDCRIPGPFQSANDPATLAEIVISPRSPAGPVTQMVEVPDHALHAGSHQGATFFQHQAFWQAIRASEAPGVSVDDGLMAVLIGLAAQASANSGQAVSIDAEHFRLVSG